MAKNLWGEIPKPGSIVLPAKLLEEQASIITEITNGTIRGVVEKEFAERASVRLSLIVPALNNYQFTLLDVSGDPVKPYPVRIRYRPGGFWTSDIDSADRFEEILETFLSSDETRHIIANLLAQADG